MCWSILNIYDFKSGMYFSASFRPTPYSNMYALKIQYIKSLAPLHAQVFVF